MNENHGKRLEQVLADEGVTGYLRQLKRALTEREACQLRGISPKTAQAERATGVGPSFVKYRHGVRYLPEDLLAYIEASRRSSTSDDGEGR